MRFSAVSRLMVSMISLCAATSSRLLGRYFSTHGWLAMLCLLVNTACPSTGSATANTIPLHLPSGFSARGESQALCAIVVTGGTSGSRNERASLH